MAAIPAVFDQPGAGFVLLPDGQKFPPVETSWQTRPHSFQKAAKHVEKGGNVGVMAGNDFIGLDEDDPTAFAGLELPTTTTWETRPGRVGMWFKVSDSVAAALASIGKKADLAQIKLFKDGKHVGEIKLQRSYQVIPPSWKFLEGGTRADYRLLHDGPPATISLAGLLADLQAIGISFSSRLEANTERLESMIREARKRKAQTDEQRARRYAEAALEDEVQTMERTPEGGRNDQLNRSAFALGQFVAAGVLSEGDVVAALTRAAGHVGLKVDEISRTIRSGLEAGVGQPRKLPDPGPKRTGEPEPEPLAANPDPAIHERALEILKTGDPVRFIVDSCSRMVLGADKALRKLICCVAVQDVRQTAGLHPKLSGDSGSGKSWAVMTFAHHLPPDAVIVGSTSNLAAFYHQDGDRVFRILDDYLAGNEVLDTIIKQTSSIFHKRYIHRTVKKQEPVTLQIGSEQTWAITSVDGSQDIQVLNRQLPINIDDSQELTKAVNARTIERYGKGEEQFPEDETVLVCREIWRILRSEGHVSIRVPFYNRIEWLETSNRRNPSIFMDLLVAHTAMYRFQRQKDAEGYYLATEGDFEAAKALFNDRDAEELVKRLTRKEREFADLLSKHPEGLTREEVADALKITGNRVSQLANGEKGKGGLTQKLPGFSIAEITDSIRIDDDQRRAIKRTVYKLSRYDPLSGFGAVVRLLPKTCSAKGGKPGKEPVRIPVRNAQSKETSNGERENREIEIGSKDSKEKVREGHGQSGKQEKISISLQNGEKSLPPKEPITGGHKAILTGSLTNPYRPYSKAEHIESPSLPDEQKPSNGDFSETKGGDAVKRPYCYLAKLRTLALMEYGMNGWVNPAKIAPKCGLLECQACRGLLHLGYIQYTRPDGSIAFRQRRSDELAPVRAQA